MFFYRVPEEIKSTFYGCGNPIPSSIKGLHVLDLGCGSGRDCYVASKLVGEKGSVTGIDMTEEQLEIARKHVDTYTKKVFGEHSKPNMHFVKGYIELLENAGIRKDSMDLVISNCVINLSPNKKQVLSGVYDVLKHGGEFYFSDVYCDRRLPDTVRSHKVLLGECLGGALYINDFIRICHETGFRDPRILSISEINVTDEELKSVLGAARFYSITYRLFKLSNLESRCEDYGQYAVYLGTIANDSYYQFDDHHLFEKGKPTLLCGNTASMVSETWLKSHFKVVGNRDVHFGEFSSCYNNTTTSSSCSSSSSCGGSENKSCSSGKSSIGGGSCCQ